MNFKNIVIKTQRLKLVPITYKYTEDIFTNFTTDIATYMYPKPAGKISQSRAFVKEAIKNIKDGKELVLIILDKNTEEFIGTLGLHNINTKVPEIGIWTKKSAHGNGYGLEAVSAVIDFARNNIEFDYIIYPVDKRNVASCRIPQQHNGIVHEERLEINMVGDELQIIEYWIY